MPARSSLAIVPRSAARRVGMSDRSCLALALILASACSRSVHRAGNPVANTAGQVDVRPGVQTGGADAASGPRLGTIHVIGTGRRFVLVETPGFQPVSTLADGEALVCRAGSVVTASLRVSHERRPPFVVADVAAGEPHVGDDVFIDTAASPTVVPAPAGAPVSSPANPPPASPAPDFQTHPGLPVGR